MRKIISVILTAALLLTALAAAPASAAEQAADNPFRFSVLSDGTAQITHCNIREGNVTVPAEIDGRAVTEIGEMAFSFSALTGVDLPDSLRAVGRQAFLNCRSLQSIRFPDSLTAIETGAFRDCTALADVTLPDSLQYVSGGAFRGTPWLDAQPDGILYLGKTLWYVKGKYDKGLVIEDGTEMIADHAFDGCESLFSVTLPASVKRLKSSVFSDTAAPQYLEILNPECDIPMYDYAIPASAVICGYMCSTADVYAAKFGRRFIALDYGVPGDVDMDGKPTVLDITLVQRKEAEMVTLSDKQFRKADVNGDGKVNILDATFLQRALAEMVILPDLSDVAG